MCLSVLRTLNPECMQLSRGEPPLLMPTTFRAAVRTPRLGYTNKINNNDNKNVNEDKFRIHKAFTKVVEIDS